MLIRFFKHSFLTQYITLFIIQMALWLPSLLNPPAMPASTIHSPLYELIYNIFSDCGILSSLIAFLLIYFASLALNFVLTYHAIIQKNSLIGAFLFMVFTSAFIEIHTLHPYIFITLAIISLIHLGFSLYDDQVPAKKNVFVSGLLIGISTLLFTYSLYIFIILYLTFVLMRFFSWREWIIPLVGLFAPFIFTGFYFFMLNKFDTFLDSILFNGLHLKLSHTDIDLLMYIFLSLITLALITSGFAIRSKLSVKNIDIRKKTNLVFYYLIFFALLLIFCPSLVYTIAYIMIPVSVIISMRISEKHKTLYYNIMIWLIFVAALYINYDLIW